MAKDEEKKKPKGKEEKKKEKSPLSEDDLEKTLLDVDIRQMEDMDETVIVRAPVEEDSGLHEAPFFDDEQTDKHAREEKHAKAEVPAREEKPPSPPLGEQAEKPKKKKKEEKPAVPVPEAKEAPPEKVRADSAAGHFSFLFLGLSGLVFLLLAAGLLEGMRSGGPLKLPSLICFSFAGLVLVGTFLRRWDTRRSFLWVTVGWFGFVSYAGFFLFTSVTPYFMNYTLESFMGPFLALASGIVAIILWREKGVPFWIKIPALLGWLLILINLCISGLHGKSFEEDLWGTALFSNLPLETRPGILALALAFPLLGLSVILARVLGRRREPPFRRGMVIPLLLVCIMGTFLGSRLLARQGLQVPILSKIGGEPFFGITMIDPDQSAVQLILTSEKPKTGQDNIMHLGVAASLPVKAGKGQVSWLMVRNQEGRDFASDKLNRFLILLRGDQRLKGGKVELVRERLGKSSHLLLILDMPSLLKTQVKTALASGIYRLSYQLGEGDYLYVLSGKGLKTFSKGNRSDWKKFMETSLGGDAAPSQELLAKSLGAFAKKEGLKQIIFLTDHNKLPPLEQRNRLEAQVKKSKVNLSFVTLGKGKTIEEKVYHAEFPSALSYEIMSASANTLGTYRLKFPALSPLPRILIKRDPSGMVLIQKGMIEFEVSARDPKNIASLEFKIDNEKPIQLDPNQLRHSLDLVRYKVKPGSHQFQINLLTKAGDLVTDSFSGKLVTQKPLRFVKPLDKDTVGGAYSVILSAGKISGLKTFSIDLLIDGEPAGTSTAEPFQFTLDATTLTPGVHSLRAIQTFSDGSRQEKEVQVQVNQDVPQIRLVRPSNGEYLSNLAEMEAEIGGGLLQQIEKVEFLVDGESIGESLQAPFRFLWSNAQYPANKYFIQARAHLSSQATTTDAVQVQLAQTQVVIQADPAQSPSGRLFPEIVEVLVDTSVSMKEPLGKAYKIDLAKFGLQELFLALPKDSKLLVRTLGGASPSTKGDCQDSQLIKNPTRKVASLEARGTSPLAYALKQMGTDLKKAKGSRVGLLITDGWDQCGEDPIAVVEKYLKGKNRIRLHILYFSDIDPSSESLLQRLAQGTGGRIYKITRPEDLALAIQDAVQVNFSLYDYKNAAVVAQPLSNDPFYVRAGEYRLEVDTVPPLEKENLSFSAGSFKKFNVVREGDRYQLVDQ